MIHRLSFVLALSLLAGGVTANADHLPLKLLARGHVETKLAGLDLKKVKLSDIVRLYGKPSRVVLSTYDDPNVSQQDDYYWTKRNLNLHIQIERLSRLKWEEVQLIEVLPGTSRELGVTGAGLRLGHSLHDLESRYGRRYHLRNIPKRKIHDIMIQWRREAYSLVATLDRNDRIVAFALSTPE